MEPSNSYLESLKLILKGKKKKGEIADFSITNEGRPLIQTLTIGEQENPWLTDELRGFLDKHGNDLYFFNRSQDRAYFLLSSPGPQLDSTLSQELRPGSSILRFLGGVPQGPAGTLTCFLSSEDGRDLYLVAAGHVVSNFWKAPKHKPRGSIYHNPKGFPSTNSTKSIGEMIWRSDPPRRVNPLGGYSVVDIDVGIVSVTGEFELKQRTTCYGTFGEWPDDEPRRPVKCQVVMKCGAEETHWTYAVVECESKTVSVYGPDQVLYEFRGQVILKQIDCPPGTKRCGPREYPNYPKASFAVPGDSGAMVVDYETRKPLGMLIAGSILDGKYVMTPFLEVSKYWKDRGLILLRA